MAFVGLDVGTTGCKAVVFYNNGRPASEATKEIAIRQPAPGWAEQDPQEVWDAVLFVLRTCVSRYSGNEPIAALGLSVQGEAVIPLGPDGAALRPAILGMDTRSREECEQLRRDWGADRLFKETGMPVHTVNTLPKLMWLRRHEQAVWRKASQFVLYEDYLALRLTGATAISRCLASRTQLYSLHKHDWWPEMLEYVGLSPDRLSRVVPSAAPVGRLLPEVSAQTGLPSDVLVATGGHDQACAALGVGVTAPGRAMVSTGTAEVMEIALDRPLLDPRLARAAISCYEHVIPGLYLLMTLNHTGGLALRWCRDELWPEVAGRARAQGVDPYDAILTGVSPEPSPVLFLPFLNGRGTPRPDLAAKGAWVGLTIGTRRSDLLKAVLEGLTFELLENLEFLKELGVTVEQVRAVGGGARSRVWLSCKADVLRVPIARPAITVSACLGAGVLAAAAAGLIPQAASAVEQMVAIEEVIEADTARSEAYRNKFQMYRQVVERMGSVWSGWA